MKPDNIMVDEDGQVKILDFGLAKLTDPAVGSELSTLDKEEPLTQEGHIVGTAPYMSPEQAQGRAVDARSDIFSFGSVLYEMVTGRRAFSGPSTVAVLSAVVHDKPEKVSASAPTVPLELEQLIHRALRKEPERRFQSVADMRVELLETKEELESGDALSAAQAQSVKRPRTTARRWLWSVAASVVAVGVVFAVGYFRSTWESRGTPSPAIPLTSYPGNELEPALSPDGKQVAFVWDGGQESARNLYVRLVEGGQPVQLTDGVEEDFSPAWSPDGTRIAFLRRVEKSRYEILEIPALGGEARRLGTTESARRGLSYSTDRKLLAIVDRTSMNAQDSIFLLSIETWEKRRLTSPPPSSGNPVGDLAPTFSPDGETLAFVRETFAGNSEIWIQRLSSQQAQLLAAPGLNIWNVAWTQDGQELVFAPGLGEFESYLMKVSSAGGEASRLQFGDRASFVSIARTGDRLAYSASRGDRNIWRVGGPTSPAPHPPTRLFASAYMDIMPSYSPDGTQIAFTSDRSGSQEIWISEADGSNIRQLTNLGWTLGPNWSPSSRMLSFHACAPLCNVYVAGTATGTTEVSKLSTRKEANRWWFWTRGCDSTSGPCGGATSCMSTVTPTTNPRSKC